MCGFPLHFDAETLVRPNVYCTVQEGQTVPLHILPHEVDADIHNVDVLAKSQILCSNFDPCIIYIPEPVTQCCSCESYKQEWDSFFMFPGESICARWLPQDTVYSSDYN